jgi:two-component system, cell cycle sensor histidine kinase and response regulator CckA
MTITNYELQIQSAQQCLHAMQTLADDPSKEPNALQNEAITEFSITLEELHVTTEELQAQNEELLNSRQALELERQRYQELFDFAPDGYLVTDVQGVIQQANRAATEMLNLDQNLMVGKPLIVFVDKVDQTVFHTQLDEMIQRGQSLINWELNLKPRDKPPFPVSFSVSTIYYVSNGQLGGFRWLLRDLSQRRQNEQKICEQADLLNVATDAILVCNLEKQILFWNQSAEQLYGWGVAEALGQNMTKLLYQDAVPEHEARQNELLASEGKWQGELEQVTQSNQNIIVESHWTLVRDEEGKPKSIFIVNTDITEKKQSELQLLQRQRVESLGTLSRGIAHDLNNILTPILGISQLLPLKLSSVDEQTRRLMNMLETSTKRAIDLIKQVQLFAGGIDEEKTILHAGALISDIEELAEKIFPKSIVFHSDIATGLWCVEGSSVQLNQVLMNLCINARDAMPHGGTLTLSAKNLVIDKDNIQMHSEAHLGSYVVITVLDTGCGIPTNTMGQIFELFFTTKQDNEGSGLGLSIVAGIVKSHHGFVTVSSRVDRGSQFQVYLPALKTIATSVEEALRLPRGNAEFILVVDDEVTILETTKLLLENFGYQVLTAQNGIVALSLYRQYQNKISAILLDIMMPSMDGEVAILGLKHINAQVKIIANSGLPLNHPSTLEADLNINALLPKPYSIEMLLKILREVIDRPSEAN